MRKSTRLKKLQKQMATAESYEQWQLLAVEHDELSGARRWRQVDQSTQYDYAQIRLRLDRLRSLRARHDNQGLLFTLNEGIHGNMGGMGRSSLYRKANFGTKGLIEQYIEEVDDALRYFGRVARRPVGCAGQAGLFLSSEYLFRSFRADAQWWRRVRFLSPWGGQDAA